jgi:hypothetical protein
VKNETQALKAIVTGLLFVVIANASSNYPPGRLFRIINVDDLIFFIHMILFNSFPRNLDSPLHAKNGFGSIYPRAAPGARW